MSAPRINHEQAVGCAVHPDAIFLLELGVHAQTEVGGIADLEEVAGSKSVRGRKKRKKAMNHAVMKAANAAQAKRRRAWLISLSSGPTEATPAEAAARMFPPQACPRNSRTLRCERPMRPPWADRWRDEPPLPPAWPLPRPQPEPPRALQRRRLPQQRGTSESVSAGKPLRPRRACSAAMVDLLHFFPSATHLATSALIGPLGALAAGAAAAGDGAAAAAGALASTGSPSRADISALFSAGNPLRPRRACSAAMVDLLHLLPSRHPLGDFLADGSRRGGLRWRRRRPEPEPRALLPAPRARWPTGVQRRQLPTAWVDRL